MPQQPFGSGTTVKHQARDAQGNPVGAPFDGIWEGATLRLYFPLPPPPADAFKRRVGVWDPAAGEVIFSDPPMVMRYDPTTSPPGWSIPGPPASSGTCTAVA